MLSAFDIENTPVSEFKKIWTPNIDWDHLSPFLVIYQYKNFHIWWDPDNFDWSCCVILCKYCADYINVWWDPEKFDWKWYSCLFDYCYQYKKVWYTDYLERALRGEIEIE